MKDERGLAIVAVIGLGLWAWQKGKPATAKIAIPSITSKLPVATVEATTDKFWESGDPAVTVLAGIEPLQGVAQTLIETQAREQAYIDYPIGLAEVPEDASVQSKITASTADAVKARAAQQEATGTEYTINWWTATQQYAMANGLAMEEAYYNRTGEQATFYIPPIPEPTPVLTPGITFPIAKT